ncbi:MAG: AraC family ligand binding domain-containing protein [Psychromonas sp.]
MSLIDCSTTSSFRVAKSTISGSVEKIEDDFYIGIVTQGECTITCGDHTHQLKQYDRFFCPTGIESIQIESQSGVDILECYSPIAKVR